MAELAFSKDIHHNEIPVLISSLSLRSRGCGQLDIVAFSKKSNRLNIFEVKSFKQKWVSARQWRRLRKSQEFLSLLFNCEVSITICS